MRKSEALRIARQMERAIERQWELGQRLLDAARDGCPVGEAAWDAVYEQGLPYPLTSTERVVKEALE